MTVRLIPFTAQLASGELVRIREVGRHDRALILTGFGQLSERSRYLRFLGPHPQLSHRELDDFTAPTDDHRAVIGAERQGHRSVEPLGIARYVRTKPGGDVAEMAMTVVDRFQGLGLGGILMGALVKHATQNGVTSFLALVHAENAPMLALLRRLGATEIRRDATEIEMRVSLGPRPPEAAAIPNDGFTEAYRLAELG
ncbi:GNAT family N-acetyltransferase [Roseovarius spongiae]|uniref:GNAT family N-acetyltransferase n=1 Tax=Roseovarius spongiae TaxID=2320272 RepID=A0A3A8B851_9RHOB|nr:GNAT family N-acetyltransferase [Roseovarius spongiae]RKF13434.1 GNAT family N-acetyltransferase [Roseovarius spongiae]